MTKVMHETFSNMMVLPNRMVMRFAKTKLNDYPEFKNPPPMGMLRVHVLEANDLIGADFRLFSERTSDPYCIITLSKKEWRTRTIKTTCDPKWGGPEDRNDFLIYHERQALQLAVYDEILLGGDSFLGSMPPDFTVHDLLIQQRDHGDGSIELSLDTSAVEGDKSPSEWHHSSVCLKLQYFEFGLASQEGSFQSKLAAPTLLSVKLYHITGIPQERARGIRIRVRIGNHQEESKKSKAVHPKEFHGFGLQQSKIMRSLAKDGTPHESIAKAFGLTPEIVEEVIHAQSGLPRRFGWDETIHLLVDEPMTALACVEIRLQDKWLALGQYRRSVMELVAFSQSLVDVEHARCGGKPWPVLDYPGGTVSVGVSVELRTATPMDDDTAVKSFELGRFGGQSTQKGAQELKEFRSRKSLEFRENSRKLSNTNLASACTGSSELDSMVERANEDTAFPEKPRLRRLEPMSKE